ncbi:hypothetical protein AGMMS50239_12310 [Bacteroidia bacterium]|nr:hypothetical protein AGMMS50239_12310 [Bacteroidia bacterium]
MYLACSPGTKWNFLHFKPGSVDGHCIGVDPYYLAQKAQEYGYHPEIILAGRRMNDSMSEYVASEVVKKMIKQGIQVKGANILVLGITFKENCPDIWNSKVSSPIVMSFMRSRILFSNCNRGYSNSRYNSKIICIFAAKNS